MRIRIQAVPALLLAVALGLPAATAREPGPFGAGRRIAGTYLGELLSEDDGRPFFHFVLTLNADGTAETSDSADSLLGFESPSFGAWVRSGPREVTLRQLYLRYDVAGNLALVGRDTFVASFDEGWRAASGSARGEALWPADVLDPLDPDGGEAVLTSTSMLRMTRLEPDVRWGSTDGDDEPARATPIACGGAAAIDAAIETHDDVDFYALSGSPGQTVRVDLDTTLDTSRLDTILGAFDRDLRLIAGSDDDPAPGEPLSFDSYLALTLPPDGELLLAVASFTWPFGFEGPGYSYGPYTIEVGCDAAAIPAPRHAARAPAPRGGPGSGPEKPELRFRESWTPHPAGRAGSFGLDHLAAGSYLAVESGAFGTFADLVTLHMDGTFSVHFEGAQRRAAAAVRGDCLRAGARQVLCEGLDRLIARNGATLLLDRMAWVFDLEPGRDAASGFQVAQEIFRPAGMLDPPDPNVGVLDEDFFAFGFGNLVTGMRRIDPAPERRGTGRSAGDAGFGRRVAGSFLGAEGSGGASSASHFVARLGADGTFVASDTSDFAWGTIVGPARGNWIRTGPRRIEALALALPEVPGEIERLRLVLDLDDAMLEARGTISREVVLREDLLDPLDPGAPATPLASESFEVLMRRLTAPATARAAGRPSRATHPGE